MPIANTECIKYYKSGMATLFHSYNPIKTNSGCWLCNKVQTWWSTSAEGGPCRRSSWGKAEGRAESGQTAEKMIIN